MEHSEEIYLENVPLSMRGVAKEVAEKAYALGFEHGGRNSLESVEGYSNLTEAIKTGESIDWKKLDGLGTKCVNPRIGTLVGMMDRDVVCSIDSSEGWWSSGMNDSYTTAFTYAWYESHGWTLWIEGEVPLLRKTADQLRVGTYFLGNCKLVAEGVMYVGRAEEGVEKSIHFVPSMTVSQFGAEDWEVIEELGTFLKPEGK